MTRISNADHVLLLLRNHLERTQKQRRKRTASKQGEQASAATSLQRVERLAALSDLSEAELKRALISAVLADELGEAVVNDAKFHRVVEDVLATIAEDPTASALLERAFKTLTASAG